MSEKISIGVLGDGPDARLLIEAGQALGYDMVLADYQADDGAAAPAWKDRQPQILIESGNLAATEDALRSQVDIVTWVGNTACNIPSWYHSDSKDLSQVAPSVLPVRSGRQFLYTAARSANGHTRAYPLARIAHGEDGPMISAPAVAEDEVIDRAIQIGRKVGQSISSSGVFSVVIDNPYGGAVQMRSVTLGPSLAAAYTLIGSRTSVYEQHLRAITGQKLGSTTAREPAVASLPLIATMDREHRYLRQYVSCDPARYQNYLYGYDAVPGVQYGHVAVTASTLRQAEHDVQVAHYRLRC